MPSTKTIMAVFAATLAVSASVTSSALAVPEWFVGGAALVNEAALANTAKVDEPVALSFAGLNLTLKCNSEIANVINGKIKTTNLMLIEHLKLNECLAPNPANCSVRGGELATNPLEGTAIKGEGVVDKILFKAKVGAIVASFLLEGAGCTYAGLTKNIEGSVIVKMPFGQTESAPQLVEGLGTNEQGVDKLTIEGNAGGVTGKILMNLASGAKWSFK